MRAMTALAVTLALALGCAGGVEVPEAAEPPDRGDTPEAAPAPSPGSALPKWQQPFAEKSKRRVGDYLMLLPEHLLECEVDGDYREKERRGMVRDKSDQLLMLETPEGWRARLTVAGEGGADRVSYVLDCGAGCMCSHIWFGVFEGDSWRELDPIDGEDIHGKVDKLGHDSWWVWIGDDGELQIVDADHSRLLGLKWRGERLVPVR